MATAAEIQSKTALYLLNTDRLDAIINGPESGSASIVQLGNGASKTLRRILLEMGAPLSVAAWDSDDSYTSGQWVTYNGVTYYAAQNVPPGIVPGTNGAYWVVVGPSISGFADGIRQALSLADEAKTAVTAANDTIEELQDQVDQLASDTTTALEDLTEKIGTGAIPEYNNALPYATGDVVTFASALYQAKAPTTGHAPPDGTYWNKVGDYGTVGQNLAVLYTQQQVQVATNSSVQSSITGLSGRMTAAEGGLSGQATSITNLTNRMTTAEGSITTQGSQIVTLQGQVAGKASTSAVNALDARMTAAEGTISTHSSQLVSLQGQVDGKASTSAVNALDARTTANENSISSQSSQITQLFSSVGNAQNLLVNSDFVDGLRGWMVGSDGNAGVGITRGRNGPDSNWYGTTNTVFANANGTPASGTFFDIYSTAYAPNDYIRRYAVPVFSGDRLFGAALCARHRADRVEVRVSYADANFSTVAEDLFGYGGRDGGGGNGDPSNFDRVGGFVTVPAGAKYARIFFRVYCNGGVTPYGFISQPMLAKVPSAQTVWPAYSNGRNDPYTASAEAVQAIDARVSATESGLSATASSVSSLSVQVNGNAASITSLQSVSADLVGGVAVLNAKAGVRLDVNGKWTGFILNNNGWQGGVDIVGDYFSISSYSSGQRTEYSSGHWRVYDGSNVMRVRLGVWS